MSIDLSQGGVALIIAIASLMTLFYTIFGIRIPDPYAFLSPNPFLRQLFSFLSLSGLSLVLWHMLFGHIKNAGNALVGKYTRRGVWISGTLAVVLVFGFILHYGWLDIPPDNAPTGSAGETPQTTPQPITDKELVAQRVLDYFNNIPNGDTAYDALDYDLAWASLYWRLQNLFGGRENWQSIVVSSVTTIDRDFIGNVEINYPYALVNVELKVTSPTENYSGETTICLQRSVSYWVISHINRSVISLEQCQNTGYGNN